MTWPIALGLGLGLPLTAISIFLVWASPFAFLGMVLGSRLLLDSASSYTYVPILPGLSIVKLYSALIIVMMGLFLFQKRKLDFKPFGIMALLMIFAALPGTMMSHRWGGFTDVALAWVFPWLIALITLYAAQSSSPQRVAKLALICLMYPIANLAVHGALFGPKISDTGAPSYHGSFGHEGNMSYLCLAFIALACGFFGNAREPLARWFYAGLVVVGNVALYLNNYRTSLVALLVFWAVMLLYAFPRFSAVTKVNFLLFGGIALGAIGFKVGPDIAEKLGDIATLAADPGKYFDFSSTYARQEAAMEEKLLSGRINIINAYMAYFVQAPLVSKITGLGPEFGTEAVGLYAHNEYVGALVEQGIVGLTILLGVLTAALVIVRRALRHGDWIARSNVALLIGIMAMTMGTMPFRNVRALMVMGIALGLVESYRRVALARTRPAPVPEQAPGAALALR